MDASTIVLCKDRLEEQLLKAKESLKGVDDNLKKFISRNISDAPLRSNFNKSAAQVNDKWKSSRDDNFSNNFRRRPAKVLGDNDVENIPIKRRLGPKILHSSISGPPKKIDDFDDGLSKKPTVSSCVIAKPLIVPSRKEALSVKTYTETRARDRRMFGALIGTLQKFRQEETQLKDKEDKKAKVEKKLEEAAKKEREKIRLERQKLMDIRKQRESYIKAVENNMKLVKEQEQWEELQQPLFNYIRTEAKPVICYLPKIHIDKTTEVLKQCQEKLTKLIDEKRQSVKEEVDSLISQWQHVDVGELLGKNTENSPRHIETATDRRSPETNASNNDDNSDNVQNSSAAITNGSWNTEDGASTWAPENSTELYSAKEQRMRSKLTDSVSVKEEKEDDYESRDSIKEEKSTPHKIQNKRPKENAEDETQDNSENNATAKERDEVLEETESQPASDDVPLNDNE